MTVIATKITKNEIIIASDSQTTYGHNKMVDSKKNSHPNASKIIEVNGMVIGCAGLVKGNVLMGIFAKNRKPKGATEDDIIDYLVEFEDWARKKDPDYKLGENHFIFIMNGLVFEVVDGILVRSVGEFNAIGSGAFLALGALYYGHSAEEAVEVAKEFDLYCSGETITKVIKR